eukprot:1867480-Rhodomonas_salina.1
MPVLKDNNAPFQASQVIFGTSALTQKIGTNLPISMALIWSSTDGAPIFAVSPSNRPFDALLDAISDSHPHLGRTVLVACPFTTRIITTLVTKNIC